MVEPLRPAGKPWKIRMGKTVELCAWNHEIKDLLP